MSLVPEAVGQPENPNEPNQAEIPLPNDAEGGSNSSEHGHEDSMDTEFTYVEITETNVRGSTPFSFRANQDSMVWIIQ